MTHPFGCVEIERMMRSIGRRFSLCVVVLAMLAAGCGKESKSFSLRGAIQKLRSSSADEMVDMAFDPDDADRRREGITLLSKRDWGLQEPYLKHYAMVLDGDDDTVQTVDLGAYDIDGHYDRRDRLPAPLYRSDSEGRGHAPALMGPGDR